MQFDPINEEKQFRRLMLDVLEISPRRFRQVTMNQMRILTELRDTELDGGWLYHELLKYLHQLQKGRQFQGVGPYRQHLMQRTLGWLESAHMHKSGEPYRHETPEVRYATFKRIREELEHDEEWQARHPHLAFLQTLPATPSGFLFILMFILLVILTISRVYWVYHPV